MTHELDQQGILHTGLDSTYYESIDDLKNRFVIDSGVKCVAIGLDFHFSFSKMVIGATYALQSDCLFLATNDDASNLF